MCLHKMSHKLLKVPGEVEVGMYSSSNGKTILKLSAVQRPFNRLQATFFLGKDVRD